MKTSLFILPLTAALLSAASPLGNHAVFRRHNGVPALGRRFIIQSRVDSPPACAAKAVAAPSTNLTSTEPLTSTTSTSVADDSVTSTTSATLSSASFVPTSTASATLSSASPIPTSSNVTVSADNSTDSTNSTSAIRRSSSFWTRIAQQDLPDVAQKWQDLCFASGGDIFTNEPCMVLAGLDGINALLADADACAQQDVADSMVDFAKSDGIVNRRELIAQAIVYRKHPRNSIEILGVTPSSFYCNRPPRSPELLGIVNDQLDGVDPGLFGSPNIPIVAFGANGTCPFGTSPDVSTCSCVEDSATANPITSNSTATSNSTDDSTDNSSDSSDDSTDDSTSDSTDDTSDSDSTDDSDTSDDSTDDTSDSDSTDGTPDDTTTSDSTSTSTGTDPTATSYAEAVDSSDSDSTDDTSSSTASVADSSSTSVDAPPVTTTVAAFNPSESVFQPSDISGNVNDPAGR